MDVLRAIIGDQNMVTAFWLMIGSLILSNAGLIVHGVISHFKKLNKMRIDINSAHQEIRTIKKQITKE